MSIIDNCKNCIPDDNNNHTKDCPYYGTNFEEEKKGAKTKIAHAAIRLLEEPHTVFIGKHHAECFAKYHTINPKTEQGFVTDTGEFLLRGNAAVVAFQAGQIDKIPTVLFSEDFWSEMYNGKHDYDPDKGYVLKELK